MLDDAESNRVARVPALPVRDQECGRYGEAAWHVVATEWNAEPLAIASIRALSDEFQTFFPYIRRVVPRSANRPARTVTMPAFPGYVLVLWPEGARWQMLKGTRGVAGILHRVGDRECPAEVSPAFMHRLLSAASALGILEDDRSDRELPTRMAPLARGAEVEILEDALAGRCGICEWSTEERVCLLLQESGLRATLRRDRVRLVDDPNQRPQ